MNRQHSRFDDFIPMMKIYAEKRGLWILPLLFLYGLIAGVLIALFLVLCRLTVRIEREGERSTGPLFNGIEVVWHRNFFLFLAVKVPFRNQVWMIHPEPYMAPWYFAAKVLGVYQLIPGSTGHRGRDAADQLVQWLKSGFSGCLTPDGPSGPPFVLKKGVLHLAIQSGKPILASRVSGERVFRLATWDQKVIPIPFLSKIKIISAPAISAQPEKFSEAMASLQENL